MSGGSFNYLCYAEAGDLPGRLSDLRDMAEALTDLGIEDAAAETEQIIAFIQHAERQIEARRARLADLWKAVEWERSCDWGKEQRDRAVSNYRGDSTRGAGR